MQEHSEGHARRVHAARFRFGLLVGAGLATFVGISREGLDNCRDIAQSPGMTNGPELRQHRRDSGVSVKALANTLGVHRATVHALENRYEVDPDLAARYLAAVRDLATRETN